ncbi:YciI family protein [Rugamonas sp. CCM 8940]|uniref:YciI family protein n=1 Tax=Rugamonas sp. CCM 8940 TaxID=2765359 RepID=UPI0018F710CF|nr:YciI family protein [Rugamonas sp. CCM 8940]MBJ7308587.1 hypothetical protein [Rugamonas sp. CCM 8940]
MQFMILRRSDRRSEAGLPVAALELGASLAPSAGGLRLRRVDGAWQQQPGPFPADELIAGFVMLEADSCAAAAEQLRRWPLADEAAEFEIRAAGCPGGCVGFDPQRGTPAGTLPRANPALKRYAVLLRSDAASESDLAPPPAVIDSMNRANEAGVRDGVLLAGEGLKSTAQGARVRFGGGRVSVVDGPFTEVKELIAGYWLLQAVSCEQAAALAMAYPYPQPGDLTLELREVVDPAAAAAFTPALREAEQRMRAQQLESGMHAGLGGAGR